MLNNSVIRFYDNSGLILKVSEKKTTNRMENWLLLTTLLSNDASSHDNPSEYPHKPYITGN